MPPYAEPFFWHRIVNVGWAGGIVVVEVTRAEIKFFDVQPIAPPEAFSEIFTALTVTAADYAASYMLEISPDGAVGTVVVEDDLTDVWVWDGFTTKAIGEDFTADIAAGTALFGYAPNLHLVGSQVRRNQLNPPFGTHDLGEVVEHTHPNGAVVRYRSGYVAITHGPVGEPPVGDEDFTGTESYYWYRVTTDPGSTAAVLRRSFLSNHANGFTQRGELRDFPTVLDYPLTWTITGYPSGTEFTNADGRLTPIGAVTPTFIASGSSPGPHTGIIRQFTASGVVSG